jgi:tRNA pseudouridine(55) synthase
MATGLLALVIGRATRLARFVPSSPKRYVGSIRLGVRTTTDDVTGTPIETRPEAVPDEAAVREAAARFRGRILQRPPAVSARSVGGERLYRLARRGIHADVAPRRVEVFRFDLTRSSDDLWDFDAEVSTGTYLRSLARDLGDALGCGGALDRLRRTSIGPLRVEAAMPFPSRGLPDPDGTLQAIVPVDRLPLRCETVHLDAGGAAEFARGRATPLPLDLTTEGVELAARSPDGEILGIGIARGGRLQPSVVLATATGPTALPPRNGL